MKLYVVIDIGCHECGVGSEYVGTCQTAAEAKTLVDQTDVNTKGWRDGGQTMAQWFEIDTEQLTPDSARVEGLIK